jgi:hypothetical protein
MGARLLVARLAVAASLTLGVRAGLAEVAIDVGTAAGLPGTAASFDVTLASGGQPVAGTQNDVGFDPATRVASTPEGEPDCSVGPATGRSLFAAFQPPGCTPGADCTSFRAIVISLSSTAPIPDGVLYTCRVEIAGGAASGAYRLAGTRRGASSPPGGELATGGADGAVLVGIDDLGDDEDFDRVLVSDDNCPAHANPGQSDLDGDGQGDECDPDETPGSFALSGAWLRPDPAPRHRGLGAFRMRGTLDDADSGGALVAGALAGGFTITVRDAGTVDATWSFGSCRQTRDLVVCRIGSLGRAYLRPEPRDPSLLAVRVTARRLPIARPEGTLPPAALPVPPVHVTIRYGSVDRVDDVVTCEPGRRGALVCAEP